MPTPRYHGRAAFDAAIVASIAGVLQSHWDFDGALQRAAAASLSNDRSLPRTYLEFATAIAGLLAAGGSEAEVSRYLRLEEERLLGTARSTGHTRWPIARFAWRAVRDLDPSSPIAGKPEKRAVKTQRLIFFEIALQSDTGGASRDTIRQAVDLRQKIWLTDDEINEGLRQLQSAHLIDSVGEAFRLTAEMLAALPRTPRGAVSTRADLWERLYQRIFPE
jgi:hypothetical protein